ncbi:MAG: iron ABC transporter permease [Coriobacteriia bacterium]|nr:iron ABC transporter permease [Coriobacteriia bacterium]
MGRTGIRRTVFTLIGLGALLLAALVAGMAFGAVPVAPGDVVAAIGRAVSGVPLTSDDSLIIDLRMPRVVLAALVGMCLAAAGVLYQALFRNALADPYILGVSSGAGLGAALALAFLGVGAISVVGVPAAAFVGALATIVLVATIATRRGVMDTLSLLLAGVAISYTLSALTSFVLVVRREQMSRIVFWMMGGLQSASWQQAGVVGAMLAAGLVVPLLYARELNIMLLGDERAGELGVDVERFKRVILAAASLLVSAAVSVSGLIGFVGLMTPHAARLVLGPDHRLLLPASVLSGGIVMVLADLVARTVLAPVELPVGIITALAGGPVFVWLLMRARGGAS